MCFHFLLEKYYWFEKYTSLNKILKCFQEQLDWLQNYDTCWWLQVWQQVMYRHCRERYAEANQLILCLEWLYVTLYKCMYQCIYTRNYTRIYTASTNVSTTYLQTYLQCIYKRIYTHIYKTYLQTYLKTFLQTDVRTYVQTNRKQMHKQVHNTKWSNMLAFLK